MPEFLSDFLSGGLLGLGWLGMLRCCWSSPS